MIHSLRLGILGTLALSFFIVAATSSPALAESEARQQLESTINDVLAELKKPELKNPATQGQVISRVEEIILRLFDFNELSIRTVGPAWQKFSDDQKTRFEAAFTTLLRETYLEKLNGYKGEAVNYLGESTSSDGKRVQVDTSVEVQGKPVPVSYRMLNKGKWIVYDVIIEGVSLVQNYRTQFQEVLVKNDFEALIKQVETKAQEMKDFNQKAQLKN